MRETKRQREKRMLGRADRERKCNRSAWLLGNHSPLFISLRLFERAHLWALGTPLPGSSAIGAVFVCVPVYIRSSARMSWSCECSSSSSSSFPSSFTSLLSPSITMSRYE